MSVRRCVSLLAAVLALGFLTCLSTSDSFAQRRSATLGEFLLQYRGREMLVMDNTGGSEQFVGGEAAKAYTVILNDVMDDYFVISRQTESDKRTFAYPLSVIRRIIFQYDGRPYQKIVLELY